MSLRKSHQWSALSLAVILSLGVAIAEPGTSAAPDAAKASQSGHHKMKHRCGIMKQMNLTDEQKAQLKSMRESFKQENAATISGLKAKREQMRQTQDPEQKKALKAEMRQTFKAMHEKRMGMMKSVLTPEQWTRLQQLKAECRQKHSQNRPMKRGAQPGKAESAQ